MVHPYPTQVLSAPAAIAFAIWHSKEITMALAILQSRAGIGLTAPRVCVEVHLSNGLPGLCIVGLPETTVKESRERVRSALLTSGFEFPARRITLNLAPADLPKQGGRFDLPIALALLTASGQLEASDLQHIECLGELALDGHLRPVRGVLPAAMAAARAGHTLIVPSANAREAALAPDLTLLAADHLRQIVDHLNRRQLLPPVLPQPLPSPHQTLPDMADVHGQPLARRALEIAAAGGHHLLMIGPPGAGKTMLASRLPSLLPPLDIHEALEVAALRSISGQPPLQHWGQRPFRAPHHTTTQAALLGGGNRAAPGEISLAHRGILFLDELPEFERRVLEVLREPLESGHVVVSRVAHTQRYPAQCQLIAAMNPCPCGHHGDSLQHCRCTPHQINRYRHHISGPLLDRIDLQIQVPALPLGEMNTPHANESSASIRARVLTARQRQQQRGALNAHLAPHMLDNACQLDDHQRQWATDTMTRLKLSARAYHRVLRVARTLADLAEQDQVTQTHLMEAIGLRQWDRQCAAKE